MELGAAARFGHLEVVKPLLEAGADVHALNGNGGTPYQVSVHDGHRETADFLQEYTIVKTMVQGSKTCSKISFYGSIFFKALLTGTSIIALKDNTA